MDRPGHPTSDSELLPERLAGARRPLSQATTLPAEAFASPAVYAEEVRRIFESSWLCAGRVDQVATPGDYLPLDLLGDKLVVVRSRDDRVRVLSRICRHRAAELVSTPGSARAFQCPYHAWSYDLDGRLLGAPFMEGAEGFDRAACRLPEVRSEVWEGWIFVSFDPDAQPLATQLAPLARLLERYRMSEMVAVHTATFDSAFNWKVLVDNFMEAYHHIAIHRDTLEGFFPARLSHTPDNEGPYSLLRMPVGPSDPAGTEEPEPGAELPLVGPLEPDEAQQLVAAVVYPFHLFAPSPNALTWYHILPETWDRFTLRIYTCVARETLDDPTHREALDAFQAITKGIHHQDITACEAAWSGLTSRSFEAGPLSPLEKPIWQFNQWWVERMLGVQR